ncbi:hypothetical protein V2G26_003931 [Clonostachys chloroleuca]
METSCNVRHAVIEIKNVSTTSLRTNAKTITRPVAPSLQVQNQDTDLGPASGHHDHYTTEKSPLNEITDTLGKFQIADGGEVRFFGSRSNFNLLQTAMLSSRSSQEIQMEGFKAAVSRMEPLDLGSELQTHLLDLFWRWQNQWQYFVSRKLFTSSQASSGGADFGPFHSPLLLTAINALASRYSDRLEVRKDVGDPNTAGDHFVEQVKIMLQYECEAPTTRTVQAVLLLSLCETARDKEALGFMYCGMATRMALNLGLHVDCSKCVPAGLLTPEEVEDRRVTWWGIYMLDKLFNIGLGRPSMIQERDITAKMPSLDSEDELALWDTGIGGVNGIRGRCLSVALHTRRMLSEVTGVLDAIYSPNNVLDAASKEELALNAQIRLLSFYSSLPSYLRLPKSPNIVEAPVLPHVYQMHLQYHVVTILLHRPFLRTTRLSEGNISGCLQADDSHTDACRSSTECIANILRWQSKQYGLRTAPISTVHCAFTAAIILLADASTNSTLMREKALRNLTTCVNALEEMETAWSSSTRSLLALRNIAQKWKIQAAVFCKPRYSDPPIHEPPREAVALDTTMMFSFGEDAMSWMNEFEGPTLYDNPGLATASQPTQMFEMDYNNFMPFE